MRPTVEDSAPPGELYCPSCEQTFHVGERCPDDGTRLVRLATRVDPFIGRELDGRYTVLEKLGQGGMGAVYRASQHSVGREVAIKVVSASLMAEPDVIKRFLREAKLASRLAHPNAVAVLDFNQTPDGVFYLVMELVQGRTLDQVIKAGATFSPERIVRIASQVCDALEGAHAMQIVHRDLKPHNIMLLSSGRDLVKVLDFGLAKSLSTDTTATMTKDGALLGTPAFMPPELALGEACDGRADLYSLGCVLYLLASGRLPFVSESVHELIAMHGTQQAPPTTGVPATLGRVIDRLLEKDPARRYQTAIETREALEAALDNRYLTPVPGAMQDTRPSLGPFPADSGMFAPTAVAPVNSASDLAHSETIGVSRAATAPSEPRTAMASTASVAPPRSRAPVIAGAVAVIGVAVGGYVAFGRGGGEPASSARPTETPAVSTGSATLDAATVSSAPSPDAAITAAPDAGADTIAGTAAGSDEATATSKTVPRPKAPKPKPPKPPSPEKPTLPPPPTTAGSNDKLPF